MKSSFLRAGVAMACALGLAACGGGAGDVYLSGSVSGVTKDGLVLQNNGGSDLTVQAGAQMFTFTNLIGVDSDYDVTVKSSPPNATCVVTNGKGNANGFNVGSVVVTCTIFTHALGGSINGLTAGGLVLVNGADRIPVDAGATSFKMTPVQEDAPYGITVLQQPAGLACSVANGTGTMLKADINDVKITCVPTGA